MQSYITCGLFVIFFEDFWFIIPNMDQLFIYHEVQYGYHVEEGYICFFM